MNNIDPSQYAQQLFAKQQHLTELLAAFSSVPLQVHPSVPTHYRMRAEFRIWHDGDDLNYVMFDPADKARITLQQFPAASMLINQVMPLLRDYLRPRPVLRHKLFQVEFLSTLSGQLLLSLLYHRALDDAWVHEAERLKAYLLDSLPEALQVLQLVGRSRKQKICLQQDWVEETLTIAGQPLRFQQVENSFTQPNALVNQQMIEWALQACATTQGDLLELYCGNGNFSLPLARQFRRVLATEISKTSVASARYNCQLNGIDNVTVVRMSAEDFSAVMQGERQSFRADEADLASFDCQTVLVDPPRAGLDPATLALVQRYPRIIYISCNPETLVDNLRVLSDTHTVVRAALFDQFPYTHHIEAGVVLERRRTA